MTPSINRLADSAKALGQYYAEVEFDLLEDEFANAGPMPLEQFLRWVTGYQYYNAIVCICGGNEAEVVAQLTEDYQDLCELAGYDVVTVPDIEPMVDAMELG
jgi:hypothetical protein